MCSGLPEGPSRRRRRGLNKETAGHYITQGPLQFVGSADLGSAKTKEDKSAAKPKSDKPTEGMKINYASVSSSVCVKMNRSDVFQ